MEISLGSARHVRKIPPASFVRTVSKKEITKATKYGLSAMCQGAATVEIPMLGKRGDFAVITRDMLPLVTNSLGPFLPM